MTDERKVSSSLQNPSARSPVEERAATGQDDSLDREPRPQPPNPRSIAATLYGQTTLMWKLFASNYRGNDFPEAEELERVRAGLWWIAWGQDQVD